MAFVSDFTFNNLSRIGNDNCCVDQETIQNSQACNYLLQNYFIKDCSMDKAKALATSQPCINYVGGMGSDFCGSNIDSSSKLLIGTIQTNPRCRIDLFQRPFTTVPYLGRGSVDPVLESQIQQGEGVTNKRTITKLTEKSYLKYHTTPLLPEVKETIQNPKYLVEEDGWIRGGVPSRELTKDTQFYNSQNKNRNQYA
jgi:hypothetical protein